MPDPQPQEIHSEGNPEITSTTTATGTEKCVSAWRESLDTATLSALSARWSPEGVHSPEQTSETIKYVKSW